MNEPRKINMLEIIIVGCLILLPFLYETSQAFRYFFKFLLYYGIVIINSILLIPKFAFKPGNVRNLVLASTWCHHVSIPLGIKWILRGKEHLQEDRACIIVSNHQSSLDVLGMFEIWPVMDKCTVVAKKELFYAWPFGLAAWLCGLIFIPRMNSDKSRKIMNEAVENIKDKNIKLWIFPEGTRRNTGIIHPFKKGAFHLAISSKLPILPVIFSRYYFLDKKTKRFDQGTVYITALSPISTDNMTANDVDQLTNITHNLMCETFNTINNDIKRNYNIKISNK